MKNKKVYFFTNIIPPYRVFFYNLLEQTRKGSNFDFEVFFMRETESNRNWNIDLNDLKFKYKIGNGLYLDIKGFFFHFNPLLVKDLIKSKDEIILGGSWNNPNVMLIAFLKSIGLAKNTLSVWSEANYLTNESQAKNKLRDFLKKWFFRQIDGKFIIPGEMSVKSFAKWDIPIHNIVYLPNVVSTNVFNTNKTVDKNNKLPVFLLVARLEENIKGIKNFMNAVGVENLRRIILKIAGTGSSYDNYLKYIKDHNLDDHVKLLGNLTQQEIGEEYKNADVFLLPSFSDPSPLSIVEAISSGLPVFVSDRCGNHFETVSEGKNGYIFDPSNHAEIKEKFNMLMDREEYWKEFSEISLQLAEENFNPEIVIKKFISSYE
ncbi:Glycosyltransferase involved in cell wall bisynthesis [Chryseobacterium taichungense]|uniref:Glycosyltransferase involved in cell wall bisynthesis n=1 Tax=Chryseobacterium taichungense TaxID=295069 RepID=A0A1H7VSQ7_9FLAO|nr:glycosyltransferase family 4 protein [Chryseobacterium taichungense]SEM12256.1 Glycosyltransferase involved in cell wall bisynthesis [Chryseobacterium taichungense]